MERLIYTSSSPSSPILSRINLKSLHLPRLARIGGPNAAGKVRFPVGLRPEFRLFSSVTSKRDGASVSVARTQYVKKVLELPVDSSSSTNGGAEQQKKIAAGAVVALSALIVFLLPVFAPPAYASFQTATQAVSPEVVSFGGKLLLTSAWTGFLAGCLHTLSGPDHLAALAPLSIGRTRMESAAVGALWGCGHDAGQVIFGLLFLLLKGKLQIEIIQAWSSRIVGLTLMVIGAMGIKEASEIAKPCVALENGECEVTDDMFETISNPLGVKKKIGFTTFATGVVHGLQPDALMMVLPALALPSRYAGAAFLGMFLIGTVFAMGSYTVFIGVPGDTPTIVIKPAKQRKDDTWLRFTPETIGSCSQALKERIPRITEKLTWASSIVAIAVGLAIIFSGSFGLSLL